MRHPNEDHYVFHIDLLRDIVSDTFYEIVDDDTLPTLDVFSG